MATAAVAALAVADVTRRTMKTNSGGQDDLEDERPAQADVNEDCLPQPSVPRPGDAGDRRARC